MSKKNPLKLLIFQETRQLKLVLQSYKQTLSNIQTSIFFFFHFKKILEGFQPLTIFYEKLH